MAKCWFTDPELFICFSKGRVHLWRCNGSENWPMKPEGFTDEGRVTDFLSLVPKGTRWSRSYYDDLVKFIREKQILVNGQGLVIQRSESVDVYLRSLDVVNMETYGFNTKVSFRMVRYLEGGIAPMELSPNEKKLESEIEALQKRVSELQVQNINLGEGQLRVNLTTQTRKVAVLEKELKKEKTEKQTLDKKVADLEAKLSACDRSEKKLNGNLERQASEVAALQKELKREKSQKQPLEKRVADLEAKIASLGNKDEHTGKLGKSKSTRWPSARWFRAWKP